MPKATIERPPIFSLERIKWEEIGPYINVFDITDKKGRYLHWDKLKWRVNPKEDAQKIWFAIKFKRYLQLKSILITDEKNNDFNYCIPHSMEAKLHEIAKTAGGSTAAVADAATSRHIQGQFLVSSLIMEEAISSAQLEGAATTRVVAKKMLEDKREPKNEDERMILNNFLLLKKAENTCAEPLTIDLILEFHKIATQGTTENDVVPGKFREANDVYVDDKSGDISHTPPDFQLIPIRLAKLCDFANTNHSGRNGNDFIAPVVKAIILHFMMGYEHPFRDGNGRTARALFYWYMLKNDYSLFKYVSISKLLKNNPKDYGLSYMYTETDQNDLTYFIDYQLDIILRALEELKTYLANKAEEFNEAINLLSDSKFSDILNFQQKDIIKKSIKHPGRIFTAVEISNDYGVAENTARNYLNKLVDYKLLLSTKDKRTVLYMAPNDLRQRLTK